MGRMNLCQLIVVGCNWGNNGPLKRTRCRHHALHIVNTFRCLNRKPGMPLITHHLADLNARVNRRVEFFGIGFEIVSNLVLPGKAIGIEMLKLQPRKAVVPGRSVRNQRIPAPSAPLLGNSIALQHHMRHALRGKVFTHGDPCLAGTHNQRVNRSFLYRHGCSFFLQRYI